MSQRLAPVPCPNCGGKTKTDNSRSTTTGRRRWRSCKICGQNFTTIQIGNGPEVVKLLIKNGGPDIRKIDYEPLCNECIMPFCIRQNEIDLYENDQYFTHICVVAAARTRGIYPETAPDTLKVTLKYDAIKLVEV